jgi:hypothetical protein
MKKEREKVFISSMKTKIHEKSERKGLHKPDEDQNPRKK